MHRSMFSHFRVDRRCSTAARDSLTSVARPRSAQPLLVEPLHAKSRLASARFALVLACIACGTMVQPAHAQQPAALPSQPGHQLLRADVPPGVLGAAGRRGPWQNYYQPVQLFAPNGTRLALAAGDGFAPPQENTLRAGMLVGAVYRFQITEIPYRPGAELYPTLEIIDRLYPPPGMAAHFPIPVHLDREDLNNALEGRLVTRVIYLEDPQNAFPIADQPDTQRTLDIRAHQDPLHEADRFGRPVAILRIGSRVPPSQQPEQLRAFLLGSPPWVPIQSDPQASRPTNSTPSGQIR